MYTPKMFKNEDQQQLLDFIKQNGFGILVCQKEGRSVASHLPFFLKINEDDSATLSSHVSKANELTQIFASNNEVLVIFSGPHSYISSSWYDHENVPTWNYISVHAYGKLRVIEGDEMVNSISDLVDKYEQNSKCPVSVQGMDPAFFKREMRGIVGFEIQITELQATYKLSQNRDDKNYNAIITELNNTEDKNSVEVAKEMAKLRE